MRVVQKVVRNWLYKLHNSFSAAQKIPRSEGYTKCLKSLFVSNKYFRVFVTNNLFGNARLGIVVSKKLFPRSVDRNRVKRIVRDIFRNHSIKHSSIDIIVMTRKAKCNDFNLHRNELNELFSLVASRCANY